MIYDYKFINTYRKQSLSEKKRNHIRKQNLLPEKRYHRAAIISIITMIKNIIITPISTNTLHPI